MCDLHIQFARRMNLIFVFVHALHPYSPVTFSQTVVTPIIKVIIVVDAYLYYYYIVGIIDITPYTHYPSIDDTTVDII